MDELQYDPADGSGPHKSGLALTSIVCAWVSHIVTGICPVNEFELTVTDTNCVSTPIWVGMVPVSEFEPAETATSPVKMPSSVGKLPVREFVPTSRFVNRVSWPSSVGMFKVRTFEFSCKLVNVLSVPISVGIKRTIGPPGSPEDVWQKHSRCVVEAREVAGPMVGAMVNVFVGLLVAQS